MPRSLRPLVCAVLALTFGSSGILRAASAPADSGPQLLSRTGGGGGNYSSVAALQAAADKGNSKAQAQLGEMLLHGSDQVKQDGPRALTLLEQAARAGEASAAFRLGMLLETGEGVAEDRGRAVAYLKAAAAGGFGEAFHNVGVAYSTGGGVKRDYAEALAWLILATKNGIPDTVEKDLRAYLKKIGRSELIPAGERRAPELERELAQTSVAKSLPPSAGMVYVAPSASGGSATPTKRAVEDSEEIPGEPPVKIITPTGLTRRWPNVAALERAAAQDSLDAQAVFGQMLVEGKRVEGDIVRGLAMLEKAAKAGSADAANHLGEFYTKGTLVPRDEVKGFDYMLQAARGGARTAMYNLGGLYSAGRGVTVNYPEALVWMLVAQHYKSDMGQAEKIRNYLLKTQPAAVPAAEKRAAAHIAEIEKVRAANR